MRFRKRLLALALAGGAAAALAVALVVTHGFVHVVIMIAVVAALIGLYLLRRYARVNLLYNRSTATSGADEDVPASRRKESEHSDHAHRSG